MATRKKSNEQTKRENALGTQTGNRNEPAKDKGYSGSADNEGGNFTDRQAEEQAREQLSENNQRDTDVER